MLKETADMMRSVHRLSEEKNKLEKRVNRLEKLLVSLVSEDACKDNQLARLRYEVGDKEEFMSFMAEFTNKKLRQ